MDNLLAVCQIPFCSPIHYVWTGLDQIQRIDPHQEPGNVYKIGEARATVSSFLLMQRAIELILTFVRVGEADSPQLPPTFLGP